MEAEGQLLGHAVAHPRPAGQGSYFPGHYHQRSSHQIGQERLNVCLSLYIAFAYLSGLEIALLCIDD